MFLSIGFLLSLIAIAFGSQSVMMTSSGTTLMEVDEPVLPQQVANKAYVDSIQDLSRMGVVSVDRSVGEVVLDITAFPRDGDHVVRATNQQEFRQEHFDIYGAVGDFLTVALPLDGSVWSVQACLSNLTSAPCGPTLSFSMDLQLTYGFRQTDGTSTAVHGYETVSFEWPSGASTVESWTYPASDHFGSNYIHFFSAQTSSYAYFRIYRYLLSSQAVDIYDQGTGQSQPMDMARDMWHHFVFSATGTQVKVYLDGVHKATFTIPDSNDTVKRVAMGSHFNVVYPSLDRSAHGFSGSDAQGEVRLYSKAWTDADCLTAYNQGRNTFVADEHKNSLVYEFLPMEGDGVTYEGETSYIPHVYP